MQPTAEHEPDDERLRHGIAVLDLFEREIVTETRLNDFLHRSRPGSQSRQEILAGNYQQDETRLENARRKARGGFAVKKLRVQAMYEHACYIGIDAEIINGQVSVADPEQSRRLSIEHGNWRSHFASRQRTAERDRYREFLESKLKTAAGDQLEPTHDAPAEGLYVDLEERAILLTRALNAMAHRSMLSGLGVAIPDDQYNAPIYDRYEIHTPRLDRNAQNRSQRLFEQAREDFWQASGYPDIRRGGWMREFLLRRRAQKMWKEFMGQFEHAPQQPERVQMRKKLKKIIPEDRLAETSIKDI